MSAYRERMKAGAYDPPLELNASTVAELRAEAKRLGLSTSGSKAQLAARIKKAQA